MAKPLASFKPSSASLSAIELIKDANEIEFINKADQPDSVRDILTLLVLILGDEKTASAGWEQTNVALKQQTETIGLSKFLLENVPKFDFSDANIERIRRFTESNGVNLDSAKYKTSEPIIGLVIPLLKEALAYAGITERSPQREYKKEATEKEQLETAKAKIIEFAKNLKLDI